MHIESERKTLFSKAWKENDVGLINELAIIGGHIIKIKRELKNSAKGDGCND